MSELKWSLNPAEQAMVEYVVAVVLKRTHNVIGARQQSMVISRLRKRMIELRIQSPFEYLSYIKANNDTEEDVLVSLLTTHHTFFFREFSHFEALGRILPELLARVKARGEKKLKVWSAACSHGQEVYSLAMYLDYRLNELGEKSIGFEILGSDVDPKSVEKAKNGVYYVKDVLASPRIYLAKHWSRGTGDIADFAKAKESLRSKLRFRTLNLMDVSKEMKGEAFDVIFCRNVFIYFTPEQIADISKQLMSCLKPGACLVTGLSESLTSYGLGLDSKSTSFYQLPAPPLASQVSATKASPALKVVDIPPKAVVPLQPRGPIRVLCVDDSKTILVLLRKIFSPRTDIEIVGTAANGLEAATWLEKNQADVMTLDLHMPELDGLGFLEKKYKAATHPKVIVLSSVSRDDSTMAGKAMALGAFDFVEKPTMNNLKEIEDELVMKIKILGASSKVDLASASQIAVERPKSQISAKGCLTVLIGAPANIEQMLHSAKELRQNKIPLLFLMRCDHGVLEGLKVKIAKVLSESVALITGEELSLGAPVSLGGISENLSTFQGKYSHLQHTCLLNFCTMRESDRKVLLGLDGVFLFVDEAHGDKELAEIATDTTPSTSFPYLVLNYFSEKQEMAKAKVA